MRFSKPSKRVNWRSLIRYSSLPPAVLDHLNDFQVTKMRWTDCRWSQRAIPEWMSADGSRCTKLRCKRIKRSSRLSSQVIRISPAMTEPVRYWHLSCIRSLTPRCSPVSHSERRDAPFSGCGSRAPRERYVFITERLQSRSSEWRAGFAVSGRYGPIWPQREKLAQCKILRFHWQLFWMTSTTWPHCCFATEPT